MGSLSMWGALATALLALECMVVLLVVGALVFGLNYGMDWVLVHTRTAFQTVDRYFRLGQEYLVFYQSKVTAPLVRLRGRWQGMRRTRALLREE